MSAFAHQRLPPFAQLIDPADDLVMIYCGEKAWRLARGGAVSWVEYLAGWNVAEGGGGERVASLVFPRRADPCAYRWPVKDKQVLVFACGELQAVTDPLVMELLHQGAVYVGVWADGQLTDYDLRTAACSR